MSVPLQSDGNTADKSNESMLHGSGILSICITHQYKWRQRTVDWDRVELIECFRTHLYLSTLSTFSQTSNDFVIKMIRPICQVVCPVVQHFLKAVVDEADYRKVFIATASGFFMAVNQRINVRSRMSYSTVMYVSLTHRLLVILAPRFRVSSVSLFWEIGRGEVSFFVFVPQFTLAMLQATFPRRDTGHLSSPELEQLGVDLLSSLNVGIVSIVSLRAKVVLHFLYSNTVSVLRLTEVTIAAMYELDVRNLLDNPSAAASMLESFALCASNVSPTTSSRSRSKIPCSKTLWTTDRVSPCTLWNEVLRMAYDDLWTMVDNSIVINSLTADLGSSMIMPSSFARHF